MRPPQSPDAGIMGASSARREPIATIGGNDAVSDDPAEGGVHGARGSCDCAQDDSDQ